jgi:DNA-directed RNA polymerase subunit L
MDIEYVSRECHQNENTKVFELKELDHEALRKLMQKVLKGEWINRAYYSPHEIATEVERRIERIRGLNRLDRVKQIRDDPKADPPTDFFRGTIFFGQDRTIIRNYFALLTVALEEFVEEIRKDQPNIAETWDRYVAKECGISVSSIHCQNIPSYIMIVPLEGSIGEFFPTLDDLHKVGIDKFIDAAKKKIKEFFKTY